MSLHDEFHDASSILIIRMYCHRQPRAFQLASLAEMGSGVAVRQCRLQPIDCLDEKPLVQIEPGIRDGSMLTAVHASCAIIHAMTASMPDASSSGT